MINSPLNILIGIFLRMELAIGLFPGPVQAIITRLFLSESKRSTHTSPYKIYVNCWLAAGLGAILSLALILFCILIMIGWSRSYPLLLNLLASKGMIASDSGWLNTIPLSPFSQIFIAVCLAYLTGLFSSVNYSQVDIRLEVVRGLIWVRHSIINLAGTLFFLGLGLLPLGTILLFIPIVLPQESLLRETIGQTRSRWELFLRRVTALLTGLGYLLALLVFATQIVSVMDWKSQFLGKLVRDILPGTLESRLPISFTDGWPYALLIVYVTDLLLLFFIGKVPLQYNLRNLRVRLVPTLMTGVAFTVVVFLLTVMLSFVKSVDLLTRSSGIEGNIFVLSEGATDELFSSLGYGDVGKLENEIAKEDLRGPEPIPLKNPVYVKSTPVTSKNRGPDGTTQTNSVKWVSKETYFVVNLEVLDSNKKVIRRRFQQLRGVADAEIAGKVHNIELLAGEWFDTSGAVTLPDGTTAVPCVIGSEAAAALGNDQGLPPLQVGDVFPLGNLRMVVKGIMKAQGSTFGSEIWATSSRVGNEFGKNAYTTAVIRVMDDSEESANILAAHLTLNFTNPKIRAIPEKKYYEDLGKSNSSFMTMAIMIAIIMAVGGIIGVMLVMFAAIAQRIKDIGVLRILGYKRWQVLLSFMIESLAIALLGGLLGIVLVTVINEIAHAFFGGISVSSNISSGQGGGKSVVTVLAFTSDVLVSGLVFAFIMGRLGGLLPSVSAMKLGILESLR
jgi:cell division protein FtsX